jgi:hypothetical protein
MPPSKAGRLRQIALVVVAAGVAVWLALAVTLPAIYEDLSPDLSIGGWPSSADVRIAKAREAFANGGSDGEPAAMRDLAEAVVAEPLNAAGFRDLGLVMESRGNQAEARQLFGYAHWLSRRDATTELWMIEDGVKAGDIEGTLAHYDHGLRTSRQLQTVLVPMLVSASADPLIAEPLGRLLSQRPPWWINLADQLAGGFSNPATAAVLLRELPLNPDVTRDKANLTAIVSRLVALGAFDEAKALALRASPGGAKPAAAIVDGSFEQRGGLPPFAWELLDEPNLAAVLEPRDGAAGNTALSLIAANGRGGTVAKQLILLEPGRYVLQGLAGQVAGAERERPKIAVMCSGFGSAPLSVISLPATNQARRFQAGFEVPAGCSAQWLSVELTAQGDEPPANAPWIDDLQIRKN